MSHVTLRRLTWPIVGVAVAGFLALALWTKLGTQPRQGGWDQRPLEGLATFGRVPDFSLVERSGKPVRLADLRGKVWVANFIYTRCKDTCPLQSAEMARIQSELVDQENARLVSISVDPDWDTPSVLSKYADRFHADSERWLFLTGKRDEIYRLAQEGFRLSAAPAPDKGGQDTKVILHSSRFVLVDDAGRIRGYYHSNDPEALKRLRHDLETLLRANHG